AREHALARTELQGEEARNDWLPRLDEELSRLPERYRLPIVLCDLEGNTRQQAARQLGWPEGTVAGQLARGRALLAKRLLRSARVVSGVALAEGAAQAALPAGLVHATVQAAAHGALSANALTLAQGVMRTMFWRKMRSRMAVLLLVSVLAGLGGLGLRALAAEDEQPSPPGKQAGQPPAKKVVTERDTALLKAAQDQFEARWKE